MHVANMISDAISVMAIDELQSLVIVNYTEKNVSNTEKYTNKS